MVRQALLACALVVLSLACRSKGAEGVATPGSDFQTFEREFVAEATAYAATMRQRGQDVSDDTVERSWRGIFVGSSGLYVDRTLIAPLTGVAAKRAELAAALDANEKLYHETGRPLYAVFDLPHEPASVAVEVLRSLVGRDVELATRRELDGQPATQVLCRPRLVARRREGGDPHVQLSVLLAREWTSVGRSDSDELDLIPVRAEGHDAERLAETLRQLGESLAERPALELAAEAGTSSEVLDAISAACRAGFTEIVVLDPDQLSAGPRRAK